jgi:hypothetical protein
MFPRPANPSAAGRAPGLLRRALRAVQVARAVVRVVKRRVRNAMAPAARICRVALEPVGHSNERDEVTASWDGVQLRCTVILGGTARRERRPAPAPVEGPRLPLPPVRATARFGGIIWMSASAAHAIGRLEARLIAFAEHGLLAPAADLLRPPAAEPVPIPRRFCSWPDRPPVQRVPLSPYDLWRLYLQAQPDPVETAAPIRPATPPARRPSAHRRHQHAPQPRTYRRAWRYPRASPTPLAAHPRAA